MAEVEATVAISMDRGTPLENTPYPSAPNGRRRITVKIGNEASEPVPITGTISVVQELINVVGIDTIISVGHITPVAVRVGGTNLANRIKIMIQPLTGKIRGSFSPAVTPTTGASFIKTQWLEFPIGPAVDYYLIAETGSVNVYIAEAK